MNIFKNLGSYSFALMYILLKRHKVSTFREPFLSLYAENFWIVENVPDYGKFSWLWKISLTPENFLNCGNLSWLWKISLAVEKSLVCGKRIFFIAKISTSNNFETIKINIFNLEQKLSSFIFAVVDEINIIFSRRIKHQYETFNAWEQQRFIHTESNLQLKAVNLLKYS